MRSGVDAQCLCEFLELLRAGSPALLESHLPVSVAVRRVAVKRDLMQSDMASPERVGHAEAKIS